MTQPPLPPFSCNVTPGFAELLGQLNCTLAISTYQAGKVIFIGLNAQGQLIQLPRNYHKAMGVALAGDKLAIATKETVEVLALARGLAPGFPQQPGVYDGLFMPRASYYTGFVDIHDLEWGKAGLWAVNTSFSCLCLIDTGDGSGGAGSSSASTSGSVSSRSASSPLSQPSPCGVRTEPPPRSRKRSPRLRTWSTRTRARSSAST